MGKKFPDTKYPYIKPQCLKIIFKSFGICKDIIISKNYQVSVDSCGLKFDSITQWLEQTPGERNVPSSNIGSSDNLFSYGFANTLSHNFMMQILSS